jgi:hypothetical protein
VYEVVHERDSVCVCVWDLVDASVHVAGDPNANANAPVYDLVDPYVTAGRETPRPLAERHFHYGVHMLLTHV